MQPLSSLTLLTAVLGAKKSSDPKIVLRRNSNSNKKRVKRGKKKKRAKEKKTVELLKLLTKHILTKQTNFLHSPEFCCNQKRHEKQTPCFNLLYTTEQ
jgi:hypothetical protein